MPLTLAGAALLAAHWRGSRTGFGALIAERQKRGLPISEAEVVARYPVKPTAYSNYVSLAQGYVGLTPSTPSLVADWLTGEIPTGEWDVSAECLDAAVDWVHEHSSLLDRLEPLLSHEFDFGYLGRSGPDALEWPQFPRHSMVIRLLVSRAALRFERGESEAGVDDLVLAIRLIRFNGFDGIGFGGILRIVSGLETAPAVDRLFRTVRQDSDQWARSQGAMSLLISAPSLYEVTQAQLAISIASWRVRAGTMPPLLKVEGLRPGFQSMAYVLSGSYRSDAGLAFQLQQEMVESMRGTAIQRAVLGQAYSTRVQTISVQWNRPLVREQAGNRWNLPERELVLQGWLRSVVAGMAVQRFRCRYGHLPQNLDALVPEYLPEEPVDPVDEQPLQYRVVADGFVIYSVGLNGVDEGGPTGPLCWDQDLHFRADDIGIRIGPLSP